MEIEERERDGDGVRERKKESALETPSPCPSGGAHKIRTDGRDTRTDSQQQTEGTNTQTQNLLLHPSFVCLDCERKSPSSPYFVKTRLLLRGLLFFCVKKNNCKRPRAVKNINKRQGKIETHINYYNEFNKQEEGKPI